MKVSSICDGVICYVPDESAAAPAAFIGPPRPTTWPPFIGPARPPGLLGPTAPKLLPVPVAVPSVMERGAPYPTTWFGELMRLLYETEMGRGWKKIPKIPPIRMRRR